MKSLTVSTIFLVSIGPKLANNIVSTIDPISYVTPCNYRPISILSFFAKKYEKLLYKYLLDFLDANTTMYKHQFGFREKHSTQQAINSLVEKITESWDTGDI